MSEQLEFDQKIRLSRDQVLQITEALIEGENIGDFIVAAAIMVADARTNPVDSMGGVGVSEADVMLADAMRMKIAASLKEEQKRESTIPLGDIPEWVEAMNSLRGRE